MQVISKSQSSLGVASCPLVGASFEFDRNVGVQHALRIGLRRAHAIVRWVTLRVIHDLGERDQHLAAKETHSLKLLLVLGMLHSSANLIDTTVNAFPTAWLLEHLNPGSSISDLMDEGLVQPTDVNSAGLPTGHVAHAPSTVPRPKVCVGIGFGQTTPLQLRSNAVSALNKLVVNLLDARPAGGDGDLVARLF